MIFACNLIYSVLELFRISKQMGVNDMFDWYLFYTVLSIVFMSIMVLLSIAMIIIVVLQQGNTSNLGAIAGGAESFFGKNKSKSLDAKFKRWTIFVAAMILVTSILFFVIQILKERLSL
jgi:preprotein translocase subunit SecG